MSDDEHWKKKKPRARLENGWIAKNDHGGFYQPGRDYDYVHKCKVADIYVRLLCEKFPESVTVKDVAEYAQVSWGYAKKCITEIDETGDVVDPEEIKQQRLLSSDPHYKITKMDEAFY